MTSYRNLIPKELAERKVTDQDKIRCHGSKERNPNNLIYLTISQLLLLVQLKLLEKMAKGDGVMESAVSYP
jgi:hypothetical protein